MQYGTPSVTVAVNARVSAELKEQTIAACEILKTSLTKIIVEAFEAKVEEAQKITQKVSP